MKPTHLGENELALTAMTKVRHLRSELELKGGEGSLGVDRGGGTSGSAGKRKTKEVNGKKLSFHFFAIINWDSAPFGNSIFSHFGYFHFEK